MIALLGGGTVYGPGEGQRGSTANQTAKRIINLCRAEQRRQLRKMDKATGRTP